MNLENIPYELHHLTNLVKKWGINDDGFRDEMIEESSTSELENFVHSVSENDLQSLNIWLSDENEIAKSSDEYINYTCFQMAYDYSKSVLKSRINESLT